MTTAARAAAARSGRFVQLFSFIGATMAAACGASKAAGGGECGGAASVGPQSLAAVLGYP